MIMKFEIGSVVEVFTKKKVHFGSWRCAEIVADNGDNYTIRYHHLGGDPKEGVNNVKIEDVRPCAPLINSCVTLSVGDVVEVIDVSGYWKVSLIEEVLGDDCYQIDVVGSIDELRVNKSRIRVRQEWKDNRWMVVEKVSGECEVLISRMRRRMHMQQQQQQQQQCDNMWLVPDSSAISKLLKRSSPDSPTFCDSYSEYTHKRRAVNKEEVDLAIFVDDSYSFIGNNGTVDILTHPQVNPGEAKFIAMAAKPANSVSNISSVGSCSINDAISERALTHSSAGCSEDDDCYSSDAESLKTLGREEGMSASLSKWVDPVRPHDLDLRSYRYILETFYSLGPLTWDQETLLTNLRMKFCVSNDEHLIELRRLKSVGGLGLKCC